MGTMVIRKSVTIIMEREKLTLVIRRARERLTLAIIIIIMDIRKFAMVIIMAREKPSQGTTIIIMDIRGDTVTIMDEYKLATEFSKNEVSLSYTLSHIHCFWK